MLIFLLITSMHGRPISVSFFIFRTPSMLRGHRMCSELSEPDLKTGVQNLGPPPKTRDPKLPTPMTTSRLQRNGNNILNHTGSQRSHGTFLTPRRGYCPRFHTDHRMRLNQTVSHVQKWPHVIMYVQNLEGSFSLKGGRSYVFTCELRNRLRLLSIWGWH